MAGPQTNMIVPHCCIYHADCSELQHLANRTCCVSAASAVCQQASPSTLAVPCSSPSAHGTPRPATAAAAAAALAGQPPSKGQKVTSGAICWCLLSTHHEMLTAGSQTSPNPDASALPAVFQPPQPFVSQPSPPPLQRPAHLILSFQHSVCPATQTCHCRTAPLQGANEVCLESSANACFPRTTGYYPLVSKQAKPGASALPAVFQPPQSFVSKPAPPPLQCPAHHHQHTVRLAPQQQLPLQPPLQDSLPPRSK
jgi:hypothetical protein